MPVFTLSNFLLVMNFMWTCHLKICSRTTISMLPTWTSFSFFLWLQSQSILWLLVIIIIVLFFRFRFLIKMKFNLTCYKIYTFLFLLHLWLVLSQHNLLSSLPFISCFWCQIYHISVISVITLYQLSGWFM